MKKSITNPPILASWILKFFTSEDDNSSIIGDFAEEYFYIAETKGIFWAKLWYWRQLVISVPLIIKDSFYWGISMLKSYLVIAFRNLKKNKGFSFINIVGLALGLACTLLIYSFIETEIDYDSFHENADRIYRVRLHAKLGDQEFNMANSPSVVAEAMVEEFPEVENSTRLMRSDPIFFVEGSNSFKEQNLFYADSNFLEIFTIDLLMGDFKSALEDPYSIILTEEMAEKYFGSGNPIGRSLKTDDGQIFKVTGLFKALPENSHFHFDFLASISSVKSLLRPIWLTNQVYTYLLLNEKNNLDNINTQLPSVIERLAGPQITSMMGVNLEEFKASGNFFKMEIQALKDIHLASGIMGDIEAGGNISNIYIFSSIALLILLMGSINFINLSTAKTAIRAKEIGVRKVLGTHRKELIKQFLIESIVMCIISFIIALFLIALLHPILVSLSEKEVKFILFEKPIQIAVLFVISIFLGIISGIYPALVFSGFKIVNILKGKLNSGDSLGKLRGTLVIIQFTITSILIASTFTVNNQLQFMKYKDLGYDAEQILVISNVAYIGNKMESLKNELLRDTRIEKATLTKSLPERNQAATVFRSEEGDIEKPYAFGYYLTDYDFVETFSTKMKQGRYFSKEFVTDSTAIVINEAALAELGFADPIGKNLIINSDDEDIVRGQIIGVMENFHISSLHEEIEPVVFFLNEMEDIQFLSLKVKSGYEKEVVELIEAAWKEYENIKPIEYFFMNEDFNSFYKEDIRIGKLFSTFSFLAIFIACLGLLGLISFSAERKTKEIGIRKTLGASVFSILVLLSKEFSLWIGISNLIAIPVVYYFMDKWLQDFAFRTEIEISVFIFAAAITIIIAILTSLYQTVKAARANPVESLRTE